MKLEKKDLYEVLVELRLKLINLERKKLREELTKEKTKADLPLVEKKIPIPLLEKDNLPIEDNPKIPTPQEEPVPEPDYKKVYSELQAEIENLKKQLPKKEEIAVI
ncbi:hypothetical protein G9A89_011243 [Geosiphon pyriformis]|nr:hypothetical protein G9A89_011243 [Geosiphon pyriformis]